MGAVVILSVVGSVSVAAVAWCGYHLHRERQGRRHVDAVRSQSVAG